MYHADGLASTREMSDASGVVIQSYRFDEFGIPIIVLGTSGQPFQFAAEQRDQEPKLQYLRTRYYDPGIGRFLSRDMVAGDALHPLSQNHFSYVANNPVGLVDPSGFSGASAITSPRPYAPISSRRILAQLCLPGLGAPCPIEPGFVQAAPPVPAEPECFATAEGNPNFVYYQLSFRGFVRCTMQVSRISVFATVQALNPNMRFPEPAFDPHRAEVWWACYDADTCQAPAFPDPEAFAEADPGETLWIRVRGEVTPYYGPSFQVEQVSSPFWFPDLAPPQPNTA